MTKNHVLAPKYFVNISCTAEAAAQFDKNGILATIRDMMSVTSAQL